MKLAVECPICAEPVETPVIDEGEGLDGRYVVTLNTRNLEDHVRDCHTLSVA